MRYIHGHKTEQDLKHIDIGLIVLAFVIGGIIGIILGCKAISYDIDVTYGTAQYEN